MHLGTTMLMFIKILSKLFFVLSRACTCTLNKTIRAPASRRTRGSNTSILTIRGGGSYSQGIIRPDYSPDYSWVWMASHLLHTVRPVSVHTHWWAYSFGYLLFAYTAVVPARTGYNYIIRRYAVCLWVLFFSTICAFHAHAISHSPFFQPRHSSPVVIHYNLLFAPLTILATIAANALPIQQHDHIGSLLSHLPITSCIMHKRFLYYSRAYYSIRLSCMGSSRLFVVHSHENILSPLGACLPYSSGSTLPSIVFIFKLFTEFHRPLSGASACLLHTASFYSHG